MTPLYVFARKLFVLKYLVSCQVFVLIDVLMRWRGLRVNVGARPQAEPGMGLACEVLSVSQFLVQYWSLSSPWPTDNWIEAAVCIQTQAVW